MSDFYGDKIIEAIQSIGSHGLNIKMRETPKGKVYHFGDMRYTVEVTIDPQKWLGLEFVLSRSKLWYPINTDLYDITSPKNAEFALSKESEIVNFLHNLADGHIKIARDKRGPMLLIPEGANYVLLKQGRFLASKSMYDSEKDVVSKAEFSTFPLKI